MKTYEKVAAFLVGEIEKSKPSQSPDSYPSLDPYLLGFEKGLQRSQHIIEVSARYALMAAVGTGLGHAAWCWLPKDHPGLCEGDQ